MRDEHADACDCPRCHPPHPVWTSLGDRREPLQAAIDRHLPHILARDLRSVYAPQADLPQDILDASKRADERLKALR